MKDEIIQHPLWFVLLVLFLLYWYLLSSKLKLIFIKLWSWYARNVRSIVAWYLQGHFVVRAVANGMAICYEEYFDPIKIK